MGVKGLWKYFEKHGLISTLPSKIRESEMNMYDDVLHPDHLFIDMNSVMHTAYTLSAKPMTTQSALVATVALLNRLLDKIEPTMTLVVVIDGVAPIAKLSTQRDRRTNLPVTAPPPPTPLLERTKRNKSRKSAKSSSESERLKDDTDTLSNNDRNNEDCVKNCKCNNNNNKSSKDGATQKTLESQLPHSKLENLNIKTNEEMYTCNIRCSTIPLQREEIVTGSEFVHVCTAHVVRWLKQRHARLLERLSKHTESVETCDHSFGTNSYNICIDGDNKKEKKSNTCKSTIRKRRNAPQVYKLIISDYMEEGEGEVKIARILRYLWHMRYADEDVQKQESFSHGENSNNSNNNNRKESTSYSLSSNCNKRKERVLGKVEDRVVIVGNDSDLAIIAMLALPFHTFTILDPCDFQILSLSELPYHWFPATSQSALVPFQEQQEKTVMCKKKLTAMYSRICSFRVDWAFIMLLAGCDYYLGVGDITLTLWGHYRELRSLSNLYYSTSLISLNDEGNGCVLNVEFMRAITARSISAILHTGHSYYSHSNNNNSKSRHKASNGKGKQSKRRVSNKEKLCVALQNENTKGNQSAHEGLYVLRGALIMLESYLRGRAVDFVHTIHDNKNNNDKKDNSDVDRSSHFSSGALSANSNQRRCVSISSIRAALQLHNIDAQLTVNSGKKEHYTEQEHIDVNKSSINRSKNNDSIESIDTSSANTESSNSSSCTSKSISKCNNVLDTNHKKETTHEVNTYAMTTQTLPSPFAQCLAVLGIRGRYSDEVRRAIAACTTDNGVKLTTTSSMSFVQKVVNSICTELNVEKLTRAEAEMLQPSCTIICALLETGGSDNSCCNNAV